MQCRLIWNICRALVNLLTLGETFQAPCLVCKQLYFECICRQLRSVRGPSWSFTNRSEQPKGKDKVVLTTGVLASQSILTVACACAQVAPRGLYAEQLSGTAFTAPRRYCTKHCRSRCRSCMKLDNMMLYAGRISAHGCTEYGHQ